MSKKHDKKKLVRRYGGDLRHTARIVKKRQDELTEWIESQGGAEAVHRNHLSSIVAAKPRKRLTVSKPGRDYDGSTVEVYEKLYVITPPQKRGLSGVVNMVNGSGSTDTEFFTRLSARLGGFKTKLLVSHNRVTDITKYRTVYVFPKTPTVEGFVRRLSVFWG